MWAQTFFFACIYLKPNVTKHYNHTRKKLVQCSYQQDKMTDVTRIQKLKAVHIWK